MSALLKTIVAPCEQAVSAAIPAPTRVDRGTVVDFVARGGQSSNPAGLASSLHQLIVSSLEGPLGVQPENLLAAIGSLAGYSARWIVRRAESREALAIARSRAIEADASMAKRIERLVSDLRSDSFAAAFVPSMCIGRRMAPTDRALGGEQFAAIDAPAYPDYSIPAAHWPQMPPQALLMMLWENTARILRDTENADEITMAAFALVAQRAALANVQRVPLTVACQLTLESAVAMSMVEHAF